MSTALNHVHEQVAFYKGSEENRDLATRYMASLGFTSLPNLPAQFQNVGIGALSVQAAQDLGKSRELA